MKNNQFIMPSNLLLLQFDKFQLKNQFSDNEENKENSSYDMKIKKELEETKKFLYKQFSRNPTITDIIPVIQNQEFLKWLYFGKVSPYYVLLSPNIRSYLGNDLEKCFNNFKLGISKKDITPTIKNYFNEIFES